MGTTGEPTADLRSNIAAEARAEIVYERHFNVTDDLEDLVRTRFPDDARNRSSIVQKGAAQSSPTSLKASLRTAQHPSASNEMTLNYSQRHTGTTRQSLNPLLVHLDNRLATRHCDRGARHVARFVGRKQDIRRGKFRRLTRTLHWYLGSEALYLFWRHC
jgi:hypothetical protein